MSNAQIKRRSVWDVIKREHLILVLGVFLFYFCWSVNLPANTAPDEGMRYLIPRFIFENGYLPVGTEAAVRDVTWGISYGFQPYLAQLIGAGFMKITSLFTTDGFALLMAARMVSVLSATATVWLAAKIGEELFSGASAWLYTALIAALPQLAFLASYVNNDVFAIFSSALILYAWIIGLKRKWPLKSCVLLGVGMGLCAVSYYNAYGWLLASVVLFFVSARGIDRAHWRDRGFRVKIYTVAGLFLAIAAWWFVRSAILYNGDFLGLSTTEYYKELYAADSLKPSICQTVQQSGVTLGGMLFGKGWLKLTYCSAVGGFGSMNVWLPVWVYAVYGALFIAGLAGCVMRFVSLVKAHAATAKKWLAGICMALVIVIPAALSVYYSYTNDFQPQGRYVLPMLLSWMAFTAAGTETILTRVFGKKAAGFMMTALCAVLAAIAVYSFAGVYLPSVIR